MLKRTSPLLIILAFIAFVSLGLPDALLGVAWPSIRHEFSLPLSRLGRILICGTSGYLLSSFFAANVQRRLGLGGVLFASNVLVLISLLGNALTPRFEWMMLFALIGGLGAGAIDAAINAFAASAFPPRWVTWLHACYGIGATLGPIVMTTVIVHALSWRVGYGAVAVVIGAMCVLFLLTLKLWQASTSDGATVEVPTHAGIGETLSRPIVWMHILLFFIYTGIEVTAGQWLYSLLTESRGVSPALAGATVGSYWAALTLGRIAFGFAAGHVRRRTLLRGAMIGAPIAASLICLHGSPLLALAGAVVLGAALAPVYPLLISATPQRVGERFAAQSIGFQVSAATVGVGLIPSFAGVLARRTSLEVIGPFLLVATLALLVTHELTLFGVAKHPAEIADGIK